MITIYPMLISRSVSENIVPGIAKAVESYIIVYSMDDVISNPWAPKNVNYKIQKSGKISATMKEDLDLSEGVQKKPAGAKPGTKKTSTSTALTTKKSTGGTKPPSPPSAPPSKKTSPSTASVKVATTDYKAIQLEPSFITTEVRKGDVTTTEFIGIKVVPMRVKSEARLSELLMYDRQLKLMRSMMISLGRKVYRTIYKYLNKWLSRLPFVSDINIMSGDPRKDIILSRSGFAGETFAVLQRDELDEDFFSNPRNINRLFKLGWGNLIIADDVNRVAYFCMKKFKGVCSAISYHMLYQSFGQAKVYESLEDAKRQSSSLFKLGPRLTKIASENHVSSKVDKYSALREDK